MQTVSLIGFVGRDPEEKEVEGRRFWKFSLGVSVRNKKEACTQWYDISVWDENKKNMVTKIKKGNQLYVVGPLSVPYIYKSKDGEPQVKLNVNASYLHWVSSPKEEKEKDKETPF